MAFWFLLLFVVTLNSFQGLTCIIDEMLNKFSMTFWFLLLFVVTLNLFQGLTGTIDEMLNKFSMTCF